LHIISAICNLPDEFIALINPQAIPNVIEFQTKWNHLTNGRYCPHERRIRGSYEEDKRRIRPTHKTATGTTCVYLQEMAFFFFLNRYQRNIMCFSRNGVLARTFLIRLKNGVKIDVMDKN
jgi:hypothetical protein